MEPRVVARAPSPLRCTVLRLFPLHPPARASAGVARGAGRGCRWVDRAGKSPLQLDGRRGVCRLPDSSIAWPLDLSARADGAAARPACRTTKDPRPTPANFSFAHLREASSCRRQGGFCGPRHPRSFPIRWRQSTARAVGSPPLSKGRRNLSNQQLKMNEHLCTNRLTKSGGVSCKAAFDANRGAPIR